MGSRAVSDIKLGDRLGEKLKSPRFQLEQRYLMGLLYQVGEEQKGGASLQRSSEFCSQVLLSWHSSPSLPPYDHPTLQIYHLAIVGPFPTHWGWSLVCISQRTRTHLTGKGKLVPSQLNCW